MWTRSMSCRPKTDSTARFQQIRVRVGDAGAKDDMHPVIKNNRSGLQALPSDRSQFFCYVSIKFLYIEIDNHLNVACVFSQEITYIKGYSMFFFRVYVSFYRQFKDLSFTQYCLLLIWASNLGPFLSFVLRLYRRGAWTACKVVKFPQTALMILLVAAYAHIGSLE